MNSMVLPLLRKLVRYIEPAQLESFILECGFEVDEYTECHDTKIVRNECIALYEICRQVGKQSVADVFLKDPAFFENFRFAPASIMKRKHLAAFPSMAAPHDDLNAAFHNHLGSHFPPEAQERLKKFLPIYGTVIFNNLCEIKYWLKSYKGPWTDFFNLDHRREISRFEIYPIPVMSGLLKYYSLKRVFALATSDELDLSDTLGLLHDNLSRLIGLPEEKVRKILPTRPRSFKSINLKIEKNIQEIIYEGVELNQKFEFLSGTKLEGYQIYFPRKVNELVELGKKMQNCLPTYIEKIIEAKANIFFLMKEDAPYYAGEIKINPEAEFTYMEGRKGETIEETKLGAVLEKNLQFFFEKYFHNSEA